MRAATATGFTMVGAQSRQSSPATSTFRPKTVRPDPQRQGQREAYHKAIRLLAENLEELIVSAEPAEAALWEHQLERLKGF